AAKGGQAGSEGCSSFTTVRDIGVEPAEYTLDQAGPSNRFDYRENCQLANAVAMVLRPVTGKIQSTKVLILKD
ncbi:hypothetical protein, partial [Xanthomonas euvesicatoria]|uniref:hypothetical protein n=1 Tax=Xanthomonas euvesicatoria TaxID=456327 RepID=UPI001C459448